MYVCTQWSEFNLTIHDRPYLLFIYLHIYLLSVTYSTLNLFFCYSVRRTLSWTIDLVSAVSSEYLALIRMDLRSASSIMRCSLVAALPSTRSQCCCRRTSNPRMHMNIHLDTVVANHVHAKSYFYLRSKQWTPQANQPRNYFRRIPTYVITIRQRYRRTDRRLAIAIPRRA